jgi:glycerophosphoryl diester phosphodiesterase
MNRLNRRTFLRYLASLSAVGLAELNTTQPISGQVQIAVGHGADHPFFRNSKHPEVIAHRGGNGQWPGETVYAFKNALDLGVDILEMDVYLTKDRHLILMHDNDIAATTNYAGPGKDNGVHNFTLTELRQLNAGYKWRPTGKGDFPYRKDSNVDLRVVSLEEVLIDFKGVRLNIEMKSAATGFEPASELARLISNNDMKEKVLVASLRQTYLDEFRSLSPDVATSASPEESVQFDLNAHLHHNYKPRFDAIQGPLFDVSKIVASAHCAGTNTHPDSSCKPLPVHVWTINTIDDMQRSIDLNVDGIITDYPGPLMALLRSRRATNGN